MVAPALGDAEGAGVVVQPGLLEAGDVAAEALELGLGRSSAGEGGRGHRVRVNGVVEGDRREPGIAHSDPTAWLRDGLPLLDRDPGRGCEFVVRAGESVAGEHDGRSSGVDGNCQQAGGSGGVQQLAAVR